MQTTKGKLMRTQLITANKSYFKTQIEKHRINIEVMLNNPTAIPEHSNIMEALENEIQHNNFWYKTTTNITGRMMYLVSLYGSQDKTNWIKLAEFYYRD